MSKLIGMVAAAGLALLGACATAPETPAERTQLKSSADSTLQVMKSRDPGLQDVLDQSVGYAVFPEVGKGGAIVGGAYGRGILYEQGQPVGYVELSQASLGAQLGGESFAELIVFGDQGALEDLKMGTYEIGGGASATALKAGAAASTRFTDGAAVFVMPRGGLMVDVSVTGQRLNFTPLER